MTSSPLARARQRLAAISTASPIVCLSTEIDTGTLALGLSRSPYDLTEQVNLSLRDLVDVRAVATGAGEELGKVGDGSCCIDARRWQMFRAGEGVSAPDGIPAISAAMSARQKRPFVHMATQLSKRRKVARITPSALGDFRRRFTIHLGKLLGSARPPLGTAAIDLSHLPGLDGGVAAADRFNGERHAPLEHGAIGRPRKIEIGVPDGTGCFTGRNRTGDAKSGGENEGGESDGEIAVGHDVHP